MRGYKLKIADLTVFNLLQLVLLLFVVFAFVDVSLKLYRHTKYDMTSVLKSVQADYPQSYLRFQGIVIVGNSLNKTKHKTIRGGTYTSYSNKRDSFYIKDGRLRKEFSWYALIAFFPVLIPFFWMEPRKLRLNELSRINKDSFTFSIVFMVAAFLFGLTVFISSISFDNPFQDLYVNEIAKAKLK